jgi:hypothetical protein
MSNDIKLSVLVIASVIAGVIIWHSAFQSICRSDMEKSAISNGFAKYNETNAKFEWKK